MTAEFRYSVRPEPLAVRALRGDVRDALEPLGVDDRTIGSVVLVLDELVNNSIEHGLSYRGADDSFDVVVEVADQRIGVEFHDPAVPPDVLQEILSMFASVADGAPPPDFERGRGLFLISDGLEQLRVESADEGRGMRVRGHVAR